MMVLTWSTSWRKNLQRAKSSMHLMASSGAEESYWLGRPWYQDLSRLQKIQTKRSRFSSAEFNPMEKSLPQKGCAMEMLSKNSFIQLAKTSFWKSWKQILPDDVKIVDHEDSTLPNGTDCLQAEIQVETVEAMQELRNAILNHNFEISLNQELLARQHGRLQLCVNKTHFCESYEQQLLSISKLTRHQAEKYKEIKETGKLSTAVHLSSVAGAGKTFLAVELMIDTVKQNSSGQVLFVAPSASLSLHFLRWLGRRAAREKFDFKGWFLHTNAWWSAVSKMIIPWIWWSAVSKQNSHCFYKLLMKLKMYSSTMCIMIFFTVSAVAARGSCCYPANASAHQSLKNYSLTYQQSAWQKWFAVPNG